MNESFWSKFGYWVAIFISAASTFMFGYRYAPQLFPEQWVGTGFLHDLIVGLMSVALFDLMAYVWYNVLHAADQKTPVQLGIAKAMLWFSVGFSTLLSFAWFILNMEIIPSQRLITTAQWLGVIAFTMGPTVQFIAWSAFVVASVTATQRMIAAQENALDMSLAAQLLRERRQSMRQGEADTIASMMLREWQRMNHIHGLNHPGTAPAMNMTYDDADKPNGAPISPNPTKRGPGRPPKTAP